MWRLQVAISILLNGDAALQQPERQPLLLMEEGRQPPRYEDIERGYTPATTTRYNHASQRQIAIEKSRRRYGLPAPKFCPPSNEQQPSPLLRLPFKVLQAITASLAPRDEASIRSTCRVLKRACRLDWTSYIRSLPVDERVTYLHAFSNRLENHYICAICGARHHGSSIQRPSNFKQITLCPRRPSVILEPLARSFPVSMERSVEGKILEAYKLHECHVQIALRLHEMGAARNVFQNRLYHSLMDLATSIAFIGKVGYITFIADPRILDLEGQEPVFMLKQQWIIIAPKDRLSDIRGIRLCPHNSDNRPNIDTTLTPAGLFTRWLEEAEATPTRTEAEGFCTACLTDWAIVSNPEVTTITVWRHFCSLVAPNHEWIRRNRLPKGRERAFSEVDPIRGAEDGGYVRKTYDLATHAYPKSTVPLEP